MFKTYQSLTLVPDTFAADTDLRNSYGNHYVNCDFVGTFTGVNFTRATFEPTCNFDQATFIGCNFTDVNRGLSDGLHPVDYAAETQNPNTSLAVFVNRQVFPLPATDQIPYALQLASGDPGGGLPGGGQPPGPRGFL